MGVTCQPALSYAMRMTTSCKPNCSRFCGATTRPSSVRNSHTALTVAATIQAPSAPLTPPGGCTTVHNRQQATILPGKAAGDGELGQEARLWIACRGHELVAERGAQ